MKYLSLFALLLIAGCTTTTETKYTFDKDGKVTEKYVVQERDAFDKITDSTKLKTMAMGTDTYGAGAEAALADSSTMAPAKFEGWLGRHRVWYISIKDPESGKALADSIRASQGGDLTASLGLGGAAFGTEQKVTKTEGLIVGTDGISTTKTDIVTKTTADTPEEKAAEAAIEAADKTIVGD